MCQDAFKILKHYLTESPSPKYPNPEKTYTMFTGASKNVWECILALACTHIIDSKDIWEEIVQRQST